MNSPQHKNDNTKFLHHIVTQFFNNLNKKILPTQIQRNWETAGNCVFLFVFGCYKEFLPKWFNPWMMLVVPKLRYLQGTLRSNWFKTYPLLHTPPFHPHGSLIEIWRHLISGNTKEAIWSIQKKHYTYTEHMNKRELLQVNGNQHENILEGLLHNTLDYF